MQAHRVEATIRQSGTLALENLSFQAGEAVEVIVLAWSTPAPPMKCYPSRGEPIRYVAPTEPVARTEWEAER